MPMNVLKNSTRYSIIIDINIVIKILLLLRWMKIVLDDFNIIIYTSIVAFKIWCLKICKSRYDENKSELPVDIRN